MNSMCMGRTVARYCSTTDSTVLPLSRMSRPRRRMKRRSASVSTKILMSIKSRSALIFKDENAFENHRRDGVHADGARGALVLGKIVDGAIDGAVLAELPHMLN